MYFHVSRNILIIPRLPRKSNFPARPDILRSKRAEMRYFRAFPPFFTACGGRIWLALCGQTLLVSLDHLLEHVPRTKDELYPHRPHCGRTRDNDHLSRAARYIIFGARRLYDKKCGNFRMSFSLPMSGTAFRRYPEYRQSGYRCRFAARLSVHRYPAFSQRRRRSRRRLRASLGRVQNT